MSLASPVLFNDFLKEMPYTLVDRFAGEMRHELLRHRIPSLEAKSSLVAFSTYGVAGAGSWVHEGKYAEGQPSPMLFNWKVLLGLTAHGRPYLAELIERRHVALAALVWSVSEIALKRYNVATYEMFSRSLQAAWAMNIDSRRTRNDIPAYPLKTEEQPVFMYHYNKQLEDPAFIAAVKETFDLTFAPLSDESGRVVAMAGKDADPEHISMIYMDSIRGQRAPMPDGVVHADYPAPPFGALKPGMYLHELLYADSFRYRHGGVTVLQRPVVDGKELPSALVINFNHFLPYREANMALYNRLRGKQHMSMYDLALTAVDVFRNHYYGVLHDQHCGVYYELLAQQDPPIPADEMATTLVVPIPVLRKLSAAATKYGVNHLAGISTRAKSARNLGGQRSRRNVSAKSIMCILSPLTPYLPPAEFRFTHRYHTMLVSPPWKLTLADVQAYFKEERVVRVAEHFGRLYVPLNVLQRIPPTQDYMTAELYTWLRYYDQMNKYVFLAELKVHNKQGINKLVRQDYGTDNLRFRPEEDAAILRYYRPGMSADSEAQLKATCFGRSLRSISMRAGTLRHEMMSQGIYDLTKLPHGQRSESLLLEIRNAKKKEARDAAKRAKAERDAAKRAAEQPDGGAEVVPV
jgi:hypothetical protein